MTTENLEYQIEAQAQMRDEGPTAPQLLSLGVLLVAEFAQADLERRETEKRWLEDLRQYRGQYSSDVLSAIGNRSKAFVRKTRVKVKTIDSRVADLLFPAGSEKNWEITHTPVPSVSQEQRASVAAQLQQLSQGQMPTDDVVDDAIMKLVQEASKKMSKVIEDQLTEARYKEVSIQAIHSGHLYGTGIIKGPLVERKIRTRFVLEQGNWIGKSETYVVPFVDYVPLWRFYPDMSVTEIENCRYTYELHQMSKPALANLAQRKSFNKKAIIDYLRANRQGSVQLKYIDNELKLIGERSTSQSNTVGQYEVLERWGWLDGEQLKSAGVKVPADRMHESFFSNVWLLPNGTVIKAVLQPIDGVTWPYHLYYFDKDETSIFAEGLSSVMRDDQTNLNAATRLMFDNAAITSGPMVEVNTKLLSTSERTTEMAPWKVWLRNGLEPASPAIRPLQLTSNLAELQQLASMCETNADEVTAIPRYMSGENATQGAAGTAAGMSMLMGAANIVIKDLITAWDEGITRPFLQALYRWNMQFSKDNEIKGDFDVKARGTASLVAKEVRARQLNEFSASTMNPEDAPFVKRHQLLRQRAEANELGDVVKTEDEVQADNESEGAKQAAAMQQKIQQLQMAEAEAKVNKLVKEAERMMAEIAKLQAQTIGHKVDSVFVALQAGGSATQNPQVAPAGDEILRSAGWKDQTPDPSIAELNVRPVQADDGTQQLLNRGQSFAVQPRGNEQSPEQEAVASPEQVGAVAPGMVDPVAAEMRLPSPGTGERAGIETPRIE